MEPNFLTGNRNPTQLGSLQRERAELCDILKGCIDQDPEQGIWNYPYKGNDIKIMNGKDEIKITYASKNVLIVKVDPHQKTADLFHRLVASDSAIKGYMMLDILIHILQLRKIRILTCFSSQKSVIDRCMCHHFALDYKSQIKYQDYLDHPDDYDHVSVRGFDHVIIRKGFVVPEQGSDDYHRLKANLMTPESPVLRVKLSRILQKF